MKNTSYFFLTTPQDTSAPKVISPSLNIMQIPFLPPPEEEVPQKAATDTAASKKGKKNKKDKALKNEKKTESPAEAKKEKILKEQVLQETPVIAKAAPVEIKKPPVPAKAHTTTLPADRTIYSESIFKNNLLHSSRIDPIVKHVENRDWTLGILIAVFSLLAILNTLYRKRMRLLFNALTSNRFVNQLMREENPLSQRASIFLSILYVFSFSLFAFKLHSYYQLNLIQQHGFAQFVILLFCVLVFYFLKILIHRLLGVILKIEKETNEYVFNLFLSNQFVGLALIPVSVALLFYNYSSPANLFSAGLVLIIASFAYRTVRGLRMAVSNNSIAKSYLFIYLCTLEILPLVVLAKVLINKM